MFFFLAAVFVLLLVTMVIGGIKLLVDLAAFVYPAYMSFKSMDSGSKDDTQWLTYWVVISFVSIAEALLHFMISVIPFYHLLKLGAVVWMYHPKMRGAETMYTQGLRPVLLPYIQQGGGTKTD